jgi:hypothetical protein
MISRSFWGQSSGIFGVKFWSLINDNSSLINSHFTTSKQKHKNIKTQIHMHNSPNQSTNINRINCCMRFTLCNNFPNFKNIKSSIRLFVTNLSFQFNQIFQSKKNDFIIWIFFKTILPTIPNVQISDCLLYFRCPIDSGDIQQMGPTPLFVYTHGFLMSSIITILSFQSNKMKSKFLFFINRIQFNDDNILDLLLFLEEFLTFQNPNRFSFSFSISINQSKWCFGFQMKCVFTKSIAKHEWRNKKNQSTNIKRKKVQKFWDHHL